MIHTKLPYNIEDFDTIANEGAIVDVSDPKFEDIDVAERNKIALIYLRNTGFNVTLDFSNLSKDDKYDFLKLYVEDDIECTDILLKDTWLKIINTYSASNCISEDLKCILSDTEILEFIDKNTVLVNKICSVYASLAIYLLLRLKDQQIDMSDVVIDNDTKINVNFINLLNDQLLANINNTGKFKLTNYKKIFTLENNQLFDALRRTILGFIIYAAQQ